MFCKNCGSQINDEAVVCPHCGVATEKMAAAANAQSATAGGETNVLAIVGFILSFFSLIIGLVCSIIGYKQASDPKYNGNGKGLALAGIIISSVSMAIVLITVICVIAGAACIVANGPYYY